MNPVATENTDKKHKTQPDAFFSEKKTEDKVQYDQHIVHTAVEKCIPWYKVLLLLCLAGGISQSDR